MKKGRKENFVSGRSKANFSQYENKVERKEEGKGREGKAQGFGLKSGKEYWTCGKVGHFRSECTGNKGNMS